MFKPFNPRHFPTPTNKLSLRSSKIPFYVLLDFNRRREDKQREPKRSERFLHLLRIVLMNFYFLTSVVINIAAA